MKRRHSPDAFSASPLIAIGFLAAVVALPVIGAVFAAAYAVAWPVLRCWQAITWCGALLAFVWGCVWR